MCEPLSSHLVPLSLFSPFTTTRRTWLKLSGLIGRSEATWFHLPWRDADLPLFLHPHVKAMWMFKKKKFCGTNTWRASHLICWRGLSKPHKKGILVVSVTLLEQSNRKSVWCQFCHFPSHCVDWESSPSCPIVVFRGRFTLLVISPLPPGTFGSLACPHPPTGPVHLIRLARPHKVFFLA